MACISPKPPALSPTGMRAEPLTAERLRDLLRYQPSTGLWKALRERSNNGRTIYGWHRGTPCEPRNRKGEGRRQIMVDGKRYLAHRLAVLWVTGHWPLGNVRHLDGNRSNNCWVNLLDLGAVAPNAARDGVAADQPGDQGDAIKAEELSERLRRCRNRAADDEGASAHPHHGVHRPTPHRMNSTIAKASAAAMNGTPKS